MSRGFLMQNVFEKQEPDSKSSALACSHGVLELKATRKALLLTDEETEAQGEKSELLSRRGLTARSSVKRNL